MGKAKLIEEYGQAEFVKWVNAAESSWGEVSEEYKNSREYYEDVQSPSTVPSDKEYVVENLTTDLINGMVGQLVGGGFATALTGGGDMGKAVKELVQDIAEKNKFEKRHLEPIGNMFYTEGMGGIYVIYNPFKIGPYGIGIPEIYSMLTSEGELLLDGNSRGYMHEDDLYRMMRKPVLIQYAEKKYPKLKGQIHQSNRSGKNQKDGSEKYCDLYTIEFVVTDIIPISEIKNERQKEKLRQRHEETTKVEYDQYYESVMINNKQLAMERKETEFNGFRMIPAIHTPRIQTKTYPFGLSKRMKGKQDQINVVGSVALDAVKADIKNLLIIANASNADEKKIKKEAAKTDGVVLLEGENVKFEQARRQGISPGILQWYQWQRAAFFEISGRNAPERGAVEAELSGKAIQALQNQGAVTESTKKFHLEYAFTEMVDRLMQCAGNKMVEQEFEISREIDGQEQKISFNKPYKSGQGIEEDDYNTISNDIINNLTEVDMDEIDLVAKVEMDVYNKATEEANKALMAFDRRLMGRQDTLKKLYKEEWPELLKNVQQEDAALKIVGLIMQMGPEGIERVAQQAGNVEEFMGLIAQQQEAEGDAA